MPPENKPIARNLNIVVQEIENEIMIYDLNVNRVFCLNETSSLIFGLCNGKRTVSEISDLISKRLSTLVSEEFVWFALAELKKNGLLENTDQSINHFGGLSRREIIKKVGLTSMIALPLISSVVAPSAAMAQSCTLLGMGAIITSFCSSSTPDCNLNAGSQCCSGMAISVMQPCPLAPGFGSACQCV